MKKTSIIILFQVIVNLPILSQIEFGLIGSKWSFMNYSEWDSVGVQFDYYLQNYEIEKDTLVNGEVFKKIKGPFEGFELVRMLDKKVQLLYDNDLVTIFDFESTVGDTIKVFESDFHGFFYRNYLFDDLIYVINGIDSITLNEVNYLRQQVEVLSPKDENGSWEMGDVIYPFGSVIAVQPEKNYSLNSMFGSYLSDFYDPIYNGHSYSYLKCYSDSNEIIEIQLDSFDCSGVKTSIEEIDNYGIEFYPNPTNGEVKLACQFSILDKIEIYDLLGEKVLEFKDFQTRRQLNLSRLNNGIYLIRIEKEDELITIEKIIIR